MEKRVRNGERKMSKIGLTPLTYLLNGPHDPKSKIIFHYENMIQSVVVIRNDSFINDFSQFPFSRLS